MRAWIDRTSLRTQRRIPRRLSGSFDHDNFPRIPGLSNARTQGGTQLRTTWETDARGQNYFQSQSWYEYVGAGPGSSYGEDWLAFYHPDDRALLVHEWRKSLDSEGRYPYNIRVRIRRHDGAYFWFRVEGAPVRNVAGTVEKWAGSCTLISAVRAQDAPFVTLTAPRSRILIADNNPDAAESLARILQLEGHEVRVAHDGLAAVELGLRMRANVAFIDILLLPWLDGYEVAQRLRHDLGAELKIYAMSGFGLDHSRTSGRETRDIDQYLTKPVDPAFILNLLRRRN